MVRCQNCKKMFKPRSKRNNKCSPNCRVQWYIKESVKRSAKRSAKLALTYTKIICPVCDKTFLGSKKRVTCSSECSKEYIGSGAASRKHKRKYRMVPVKRERVFKERSITSSDLEGTRDPSTTEAIKNFKKEGGKIQVLTPEPSAKIPSVDLGWGQGGWDWQALYGAGTYTGVADYLDYSKINNKKTER